MQLTFEHDQYICDGHNPAGYHTPDNKFQVMFTEAGEVQATVCDTDMGAFDDREFTTPYLVSGDDAVTHLRVTYLPRVNLFAHWESEGRHRLSVLILKQDGAKWLNEGKITFTEEDPSARISLTLENPEGIFAAEGYAGINPGARIHIWFSMGDSSRIEMGRFYVDRVKMSRGDPLVTIEGRNTIGKLLKGQTFDEKGTRMSWLTEEFFGEILDDASISNYDVQEAMFPSIFEFPRSKSFYDGIVEAIRQIPNWRIREMEDGRIVIGHADTYAEFTEGTHTFNRDTDCFSREVIRDDEQVYSRICVWFTEKWSESVGEIEVLPAEELGTGDGANQTFHTGIAPIKAGLTLVYIDDLLVNSAQYVLNNSRGSITFTVPPALGEVVTASFTGTYASAEFETLGEYDGTTPIAARTAGRPLVSESVEVWCKTTHGAMINLTGLEAPPSPDVWYTLDMTTGEFTAGYLQGEYFINYTTSTSEIRNYSEDRYHYADVEFQAGWNMPRQKTVYVQLLDNTTEAHALNALAELVAVYSVAGNMETFVSPFRPQVQPGDAAEVSTTGAAKAIGLITQVEHSFGRSGFFTQFVVDSGGIAGKPTLSRYIEMLTNRSLIPKGLYKELE